MLLKTKKYQYKKIAKFGQPSDHIFRGVELKIVINEISKLSLENPSLDLGCGDGYLNRVIFKSKFDFGLDNDEAGVVKKAIRKHRYQKVIIESATKMSLPSNSLNLVFSNSVIEHIPENKKLVKEVSRVLKKNGYFIFTCPSNHFTKYLSKNFGGTWYAKLRNKQFNHFHLLSHKTWKKRLSVNNLQLIDYFYYLTEPDLVFWEKILWQQKLHKYLPFIFENPKCYQPEIKSRVLRAKASKKEGANILIIARKK